MQNGLSPNQFERLADNYPNPSRFVPSEGGHMAYIRMTFMTENDDTYFVKAHDPSLLDDKRRQSEMLLFLEKEVAMYKHVRSHEFRHIPEHSDFNEDMLILSGLTEVNGWHWRAPQDDFLYKRYSRDIVSALCDLELVPTKETQQTGQSSLDVFYNQGWDTLDENTVGQITSRGLKKWHSHLGDRNIQNAERMIHNTDLLRVDKNLLTTEVLNHHDARQANIAWHPDNGVAIIDWSWADLGLKSGDSTMFLIDLHKSGRNISNLMDRFNPDYAKMMLGFWLQRSQTEHMPGNQTVRLQQFISAIKASELILDQGAL